MGGLMQKLWTIAHFPAAAALIFSARCIFMIYRGPSLAPFFSVKRQVILIIFHGKRQTVLMQCTVQWIILPLPCAWKKVFASFWVSRYFFMTRKEANLYFSMLKKSGNFFS